MRSLRYIILLLIAITFTLPARAAYNWSGWGSDAIPWVEGEGTQSSPYILRSPQNLRYLALYVNGLLPDVTPSAEKLYFKLGNSIDLGGEHMLPIGNGNTPFIHDFDGDGLTISNFVIDWSNNQLCYDKAGEPYTLYGLFGYVEGKNDSKRAEIHNLNITGALATQSATGARQYTKIGILVGKAGKFVNINNISISNSRIDDGGVARSLATILVGGVIGEMSQAYLGYTGYNGVTIRNIFSNVDIDLSNVTHGYSTAAASSYTEYNVGGIVGRMRRCYISNIPQYTVYTGSIKAPCATIGPNYGILRGNADNTTNASLANAWTGENHTGTGNDAFVILGDFDQSADPTTDIVKSWFYGYRIWFDDAYVDITDSYPTGNDADANYASLRGSRPLIANGVYSEGTVVAKTGDFDRTSQTADNGMGQYQGVNRGRLATAADQSALVVDFNTRSSINWVNVNGVMQLRRDAPDVALVRTGVHTYHAQIGTGGGSSETLKFIWSAKIEGIDTPVDIWTDPDMGRESTLEISSEMYAALSAAAGHPVGPNELKYVMIRGCRSDNTPIDGTNSLLTPVKIHSIITHPIQWADVDSQTESYRVTVSDFYTDGTPVIIPGVGYRWEVQNANNEWITPALASVIGSSTDNFTNVLPTTFDRQIRACAIDSVSGVALMPGEYTLKGVDASISSIATAHLHYIDLDVNDPIVYGASTKPYSWENPDMWTIKWEIIPDTGDPIVPGDKKFVYKLDYDLLKDKDWAAYTVRATIGSYTTLDPDQLHPIVLDIRMDNLTSDIVDEGDGKYRARVMYAWFNDQMGHDAYPGASAAGCTWKWYKSADGETWSAEIPGETGPVLSSHDSTSYYKFVWTDGVNTQSAQISPISIIYVYNKESNDAFVAKNVAGLPQFDGTDGRGHTYPAGVDTNSGADPDHAVKTLREAYRRLPATNPASRNKIVVMGFAADPYYIGKDASIPVVYPYLFRELKGDLDYKKAVTISGRHENVDFAGAIQFADPDYPLRNGMEANELYLTAPTVYEYLVMYGESCDGNQIMHLHCCNNDITIGEDVIFANFTLTSTKTYGLSPTSRMQDVSIIAGDRDKNEMGDLPYSPFNAIPRAVSIKIKSGGIGRIIGCARNDKVNEVTHNICGTPDVPMRTRIEVNIPHARGIKGERCPEYYKLKKYSHDIGLIVGGQTDGSVFADVKIDILDAVVARYAAGNISFSREIPGHPNDSFFGKTVLNVHGGEIDELFGGSIGRKVSSTADISDECTAFFYGISEINVYDAVIRSNIYAAGSGGVSGVGTRSRNLTNLSEVTSDRYIPYISNLTGKLHYGDYDELMANGTMPQMADYDGNVVDLFNTRTEINIYSGQIGYLDSKKKVVGGNVYGGGYGYSNSLNAENVPRAVLEDGTKLALSGNLYGSSRVNIREIPGYNAPLILGNVYGGGAGSQTYYKQNRDSVAKGIPSYGDFTKLALLFGSTDVEIRGGTIQGHVYGGSQGIEGDDMFNMAEVYGSTRLVIANDTIVDPVTNMTHIFKPEIKGNIYGGCALANISKRYPADSGVINDGGTDVTILGGTIGDCIFGGSEGSTNPDFYSKIEGSTKLYIAGNPSFNTDVLAITGSPKRYNIYGGGYYSCDVMGDATVTMNSTPLTLKEGFDFLSHWKDVTYRRFCVYGGGFGENTTVRGSTYVTIDIPENGTIPVRDASPTEMVNNQMVFDVCGGGFNGNVGYWADANGLSKYEEGYISSGPDSFAKYEGGSANVTIKGNAFVRKVNGGGFYASVPNAHTRLISGSIETVIGGALLGYVYDQALLEIGSQDDAASNARLFIHGDAFGGNDVKGIVGVARYRDNISGEYSYDIDDGEPLLQADIMDDERRGVVFNIFGGTIGGDVYGAGNGHYRGYYVPEWTEYNEGNARCYRTVHSQFAPSGSGKVYRSRPMTGCVNMNIRGNDSIDRVVIRGSVFGSGKSATIGQWDTKKTFNDPRRLMRGGHLHMNMGGHVTIGGDLFMGARGHIHGNQTVVPAGFDLDTEIKTSERLDQLGEAAYDHWYWNSNTNKYCLGFAAPGEVYKDVFGNDHLSGEHQLRGFMKHIEMNGNVELTFYRDLYDGEGNRKRWLPAEETVGQYNADDIDIGSFYLGGECGSMTNNVIMEHTYSDTGLPEQYPSIYRISLPSGVTIRNRVVMGSLNAVIEYHPYKDGKFEEVDRDSVMYTFNGGVVPQTVFSYELIAFSDYYNTLKGINYDTDDYYAFLAKPDAATYPDAAAAWPGFISNLRSQADGGNTYILTFGPNAGTEIHRKLFLTRDQVAGLPDTDEVKKVDGVTFGLAMQWLDEAKTKEAPFIGHREVRKGDVAVKLGANCKFKLQHDPDHPGSSEYRDLYGGLIYGGCFQSGHTNGDVILNVISNTLDDLREDWESGALNDDELNEISTIKYNFGRVYGGGFGAKTKIVGSTYVNALANFASMYVFGGGHEGTVTGSTNVNYFGSEDSFILGAIYGGGLRGTVGTYLDVVPPGQTEPVRTYPDVTTHVNLYSGNVDKVYGGACLADVYGGTSVELCDEITVGIEHIDYERVKLLPGFDDLAMERLIAGIVFGGNDIAGHIYTNPGVKSTSVKVTEVQGHPESQLYSDKKDTPGADGNGFIGFPLIGCLYGGSNGNYGIHSEDELRYLTGSIVDVATGYGAESYSLDLSLYPDHLPVPHVNRTRLDLLGGTIVTAYGGGDRASVLEDVDINVAYAAANDEARAGFENEAEAVRVWGTLDLTSNEQFEEVLDKSRTNLESEPGQPDDYQFVYKYQIYRIFGGNNNADMAIQPRWNLNKAYIGSVYSGGNFGRMTYYNPDADPTNPAVEKRYKGLQLTIESDEMHIENVYGGGRIGDIDAMIIDPVDPTVKTRATMTGDDYGATLNILGGVIHNVYGGNDVSGLVYNGTNVNIAGAISGNVYCAGNGDHRYLYDPNFSGKVEEYYDYDKDGVVVKGRYFRLPAKAAYGGSSVSDEQRILAINSYRPNIERSYLNIGGTDTKPVFVFGNVYCGGNSATVTPIQKDGEVANDIRFKIGDYVTLNGVFLGSNGEHLTQIEMIEDTEKLNGINLTQPNGLMTSHLTPMLADNYARNDSDAINKSLYPNLLDIYMRAVEVKALPQNFRFSRYLNNAMIGEFYVGGNRGSMMTDKTISLVFPAALTIFGHICGGSRDANVTLRNVTHIGGLKTPLADKTDEAYKLHLQVKSNFEPWRVQYPNNGDIHDITLVPDLTYDDTTGKYYLNNGRCNVYGGCYESGTVVSGIHLDLFSDMMKEYKEGSAIADSLANYGITSKKSLVIDVINDKHWRTFSLIGAGYGANTSVYGDIEIDVLPSQASPSYALAKSILGDAADQNPSAATIFAGSQDGLVVGNTTMLMRDGTVFTNLYGASEAARLYGSTQIMVGWPKYYVCEQRGEYDLKRADQISRGSTAVADGQDVVKKKVKFRKGDIVSEPLYDMITDADKSSKFRYVDDDMPYNFIHRDSNYVDDNGVKHILESTPFSWNDIDIHIGDADSRGQVSGSYFGHGNVYGGGYISPQAQVTLAGKNTVCFFNDKYNNDPNDVGYGGNTTIIVHDNADNADLTKPVLKPYGEHGDTIREHITIGTAIFRPVKVKEGQNVMGKYKYDPASGHYLHQSSHRATAEEAAATNLYYEVESDGGIYGGGRQVFVDGFSSCDIAYYGYTTYTPQFPKLINTFQRLDVLRVTDCCIQLQGAPDFTSKSASTEYAMTRIGELQMNSSIHDYTDHLDLDPGMRGGAPLFNIEHDTRRSRNYIALFSSVRYLSAITSSTSFDNVYRGANGVRGFEGDFENPDPLNPVSVTPSEALTYKQYKQACIDQYYDAAEHYGIEDQEMIDAKLKFDRRNIGTSANMIGINNGYTLRIQGPIPQENGEDDIYYGPINGVVEIKLLTLARDEGGGYVYAFNKHEDPDNFLESTGNFVFPGAAYNVSDSGDRNYNYIYDDCFPMGVGFDGLASPEDEERHYWYVNGSHFFYDVTLTAYTYNNPVDFTLDNSDQLIYLYGMIPNSKFSVEEVMWEVSQNTDSDLQNHFDNGDTARENNDYRLYFSVDRATATRHTLDPDVETNSFVARMPCSDYLAADGVQPLDLNVAYPDSIINNYGVQGDNVALLGITLRDFVDNSAKEYYEERLRKPEHVRITLKGEAPADDHGGVNEYTYTINLTIQYLLGPIVNGAPVIENCALPGEYIFAHSKDVSVEMDTELMAVTARNWYIVPPSVDVHDHDQVNLNRVLVDSSKFTNSEGEVIDDRQIHLTAYRYLNDWQLVYGIKANNYDFYVPVADDAAIQRIGVHNYHRGCPWNGSTVETDVNGVAIIDPKTNETIPVVENLYPVAGARIYIEDDRDMYWFIKMLQRSQTGMDTQIVVSGDEAYPVNGKDLMVFLMNDVTLPEKSIVGDLSDLVSEMKFYGNGHRINLSDQLSFIGENKGYMSDVAFISALKSADAQPIATNSGTLRNCYFYNTASSTRGMLVGNEGGIVDNCYQNTPAPNGSNIHGSAIEAFEYGSAAYDLNKHYLERRFGNTVEEIEVIFNDGEYRYARVGNTADALRTAERPNYRDYLGRRQFLYASADAIGAVTGADATNHNTAHTQDDSRFSDVDNLYHPTLTDHIFFGQDLSVSGSLPQAIETTKRVYRASGFYGSKADLGYHFNADKAMVRKANLTAIDFTGRRDQGRAASQGMVSYNDAQGKLMQAAFYPPMLDMPKVDDGGVDVEVLPDDVQINGNDDIDDTGAVTKNLLVYTATVSGSAFDQLHYSETDAERTIAGHHLMLDAEGNFDAANGLLHLVDKQDFNAPIEFGASQRAWYDRLPVDYSSGNSAWEGICLPFTPTKLIAKEYEQESPDGMNDHGELTHFYGDEEILHEYWLRGLTGKYNGEASKLVFSRPTLAAGAVATPGAFVASNLADEAGDALTMYTDNYFYCNTWFVNTYGNLNYITQHNQYTDTGRTFNNYLYLTEGIPYIISFPGTRYYEFDMSGKFFQGKFGGDEYRQMVTYERRGGATLRVSDDRPAYTSAAAGYKHNGTYMHHALASNEYTIMADYDGEDLLGTKFSGASQAHEALPFRTYIVAPNSRSRAIYIGEAGGDKLGDPEQQEEQHDIDEVDSRLIMSVENNALVIDAPCALTIVIYDAPGREIRSFEVEEGRTIVDDLAGGVYIAASADYVSKAFKFLIK